MKQLQNATEGHSFWNAWSNGGNILYVDVNNHYRVKVFYGYFSQIMAQVLGVLQEEKIPPLILKFISQIMFINFISKTLCLQRVSKICKSYQQFNSKYLFNYNNYNDEDF